MKYVLTVLLAVIGLNALANDPAPATVAMDNNQITQIVAYDDYEDAMVRVEISNSHSSCPVGGYIKRSSPGFETVYTLALVAATTKRKITIQLHTHIDNRTAGLCEIDAIRLSF